MVSDTNHKVVGYQFKWGEKDEWIQLGHFKNSPDIWIPISPDGHFYPEAPHFTTEELEKGEYNGAKLHVRISAVHRYSDNVTFTLGKQLYLNDHIEAPLGEIERFRRNEDQMRIYGKGWGVHVDMSVFVVKENDNENE